MGIVDSYDKLPEQLPDTLQTKPLYSEQSAQQPINPLVGSAAQAGWVLALTAFLNVLLHCFRVKSESDEVKMVPHVEYNKRVSTVEPTETCVGPQCRQRKSATQPEISKKWSISLFNRRKRIPTLEEVKVRESGTIEFGPKREVKNVPGNPDIPVTFTVPGSQETERQTERNKEMYMDSIKEDLNEPV